MYISDFIGKTVLSLENAKNLGYVLNVCFDSKFSKVVSLFVVNDEDEYDYSLPVLTITKISNECVFVESENALQMTNQQEVMCAIGKRAVSLDGGDDFIKDVEITLAFMVKRVQLSNSVVVGAKRCVCFGQGGLIYRKNSKKVVVGKKEVLELSNKMPLSVSPIDFGKMVGTRLVKTLSLPNGEVFARKGQIITEDIISVAKKFGILANLL